ncbi:MAG: NifU family protein [Caldilineaceae bacterium]|nr:NifU family protein [Caldilineaceae bacterium]
MIESVQVGSLEARIQQVLDDYRPTLYIDGGDVELLRVDEQGVAHVKMLGACIDCPISLLTMKLGIQRLLKENFSEITGLQAETDIDIAALYNRSSQPMPTIPTTYSSSSVNKSE